MSSILDKEALTVTGRLFKLARLTDEYYTAVNDAESLIKTAKALPARPDILTFVQEISDLQPRFKYRMELDRMAVLPLTTYDNWINKQITFKPRNKVKKALKSGIIVSVVPFSDDLVHGIMEVYNETPIRQGKKNWHYGKDFETLRREHSTFLDRSEFIAIRYQNEFIAFAKVTHCAGYSILMNIVAKVAHRDKAPTNALLAKTIELCAAKGSRHLNYGVWGRRGLNDFKVASGFQRYEVPRYFVPLSAKGRLLLAANLHRSFESYLPDSWVVRAAEMRAKWNEFRYRRREQTVPRGQSAAPSAA